MFGGFNPFGHDGEVQTFAKVNDGVGNSCVFLIDQQVPNELLVDFQVLNRHLLQVGERRVSGAKIVHRDADACPMQAMQLGHGIAEIGHEAGFGYLKL